ncbi:AfsR/SARP family transcriptional regulator [Arthrobacter mobilis]|uniref:AAA family ATPase n=1 Tax=Arthrobacter mobilis TaxID=2724944 RepID=A0A7X6K6R2_9MICC|nr:AfsR/SARP family transcriptional regulator [Arthrobacter mobilis]NKX55805.1 AAA family ATPase [Arthrobacter mobilis]
MGGWRQRAVLARLLIARGQAVSADRLIDDVWGSEPPDKALLALQSYVSRLRRLLEPARAARGPATVLVSVPTGYRLRLHRDQVDAWQFEQAFLGADLQHLPADLVRRNLGDALALWRGAAYADFAGEPWAAAEIARLDELRYAARERHAAASLALGKIPEAVASLEAILDQSPLRETAWQLLVLALYRGERQGDALAAVRRARRVLADELGVEPGPALRRLESDVLAQSPALWDDIGPVPAFPPVEGRAPVRQSAAAPDADPFLGRTAELDRLLAAAELARRPVPSLALVEGQTGTGKTRLVMELAGRLRSEGWFVAVGRCDAEEGAPAGLPWAAVVDELHHRHPDEFGQPLESIFAPGAEASGGSADPVLARFRLHRRIAAFLHDVAATAPVLIVLDDIHLADAETLSILNRVVFDLAADPVLFVCIQQTGEKSIGASNAPNIARKLLPVIHIRLELGGLPSAEVATLLRTTASPTLPDEAVAAIHRWTGGNVLFVRQIGSLLAAHGGELALSEVPAGIRDIVRHRLAQLPEESRLLLNTLAVIGMETDADVLESLDYAPDQAWLDAVEAALRAGLLVESRPGRVGFAHGVVREAINADLSNLRKSQLHARIGQAVEAVHPEDLSALAYHYARSGKAALARKAVDYSSRAAERTESRFAFREAAALWQQALDCLAIVPGCGPRERLELMIRLVRATALGGEAARARDLRDQALHEPAAAEDVELTARIITSYDVPSLWVNQEYGMVVQPVVDLIESALDGLPDHTSALRCQLLTCLALELEWSGLDRGREAAAEAAAMARELEEPLLLAKALEALFRQSYLPGQLGFRDSLAHELLALAKRHRLITTEVIAHLMMTECACAHGSFGVADEHHAETKRLAEKYQLPSPLAVAAWYEGLRHLVDGRFAEAEEAYRAASRLSAQVRLWEVDQAWVVGTTISLAMLQGRMNEILELAEAAFAKWPVMGREVYAQSLMASGQADAARRIAGQLPPVPYEASYLLTSTWRALTGLSLDDRRRIEWAYRALEPYLDELAGADTAVVAHGPVAQIAGDLALRMGLREEAAGHYQHALAVAGRADSSYWAAAARAALAALGP